MSNLLLRHIDLQGEIADQLVEVYICYMELRFESVLLLVHKFVDLCMIWLRLEAVDLLEFHH